MFSLDLGEAAPGVTLRTTEPSDRVFLRALYAASRVDGPILALWAPEQREPFLDDQFRFQDVHYRRFYPDADFLVVEERNVPIGRLILDRARDAWLVVDISLMPRARSRGLGSTLLRAAHVAAATEAGGLRLEVEIVNARAHKLYARLGFVEIGRSDTHIAMLWR